MAENWQSEYLQFFLYVGATVWLLQRGSPESKELDKAGVESDQEQRVGEHAEENSPKWAAAPGWRRAVYSHSLLLVMGTIFVLCWLVQSITGSAAFNEQRLTPADVSYRPLHAGHSGPGGPTPGPSR